MADQYTDTNDRAYVDTNDPAYAGTTGHEAYPNHGVDGNNDHDPAKGAGIGAVGGAVVGGLAGGPIGAVIGAVAGGLASGAGVAAVDKVDNDNSPREHATTGDYVDNTDTAYTTAGTTYGDTISGTPLVDDDLDSDATIGGTGTRYTTADTTIVR